jgi:regulator of protease activity HflC (stomatin/prohibitin superfamily)
MDQLVIALGIVFIVIFIYFALGIRIVQPYQKGVLEQLGKFKQVLDPGLHLIYPFFQKVRLVDMREQVVDVPPQEVITEDNVVVSVDAVIYYEPTDPQRLIYNVASFILAVTKLAQTNLRNLIGDLDLDAALTSRDQINLALRQILDDATDKWGVRVARVEIQRIDPPPDVMSAMHEQMKAERTRRAVVLEADGAREAAIARAEGEKRSAILTAEGRRESQVLQAEGEAEAIRRVADAEQYRQQIVAQGQADAIRSVYQAIHDGDPTDDLIAIKYLETLTQMADGNATKIFLPAEMSGVMGSIAGVAELFNESPAGEARHRAPRPKRVGSSAMESETPGMGDVDMPPPPPAPPTR